MKTLDKNHQQVLGVLASKGIASSLDLQGSTGCNPETWNLETMLFAALHLHDAPGAISIGDATIEHQHPPLAIGPEMFAASLDTLAMDVARTLPAGSSAGGEQPKFIAQLETGQHVIVKFTPPSGTPFGDRWRDLLYAEALASSVLADYGVPVAKATVLESPMP